MTLQVGLIVLMASAVWMAQGTAQPLPPITDSDAYAIYGVLLDSQLWRTVATDSSLFRRLVYNPGVVHRGQFPRSGDRRKRTWRGRTLAHGNCSPGSPRPFGIPSFQEPTSKPMMRG